MRTPKRERTRKRVVGELTAFASRIKPARWPSCGTSLTLGRLERSGGMERKGYTCVAFGGGYPANSSPDREPSSQTVSLSLSLCSLVLSSSF